MTNPVTCSKCNVFLGNLYFLNSKINSSVNNITYRKNKIFYIADEKTQASLPYCQKCWPNYVINNPLIKQKTDPVIEANYALYLNEYAENSQTKKELKKRNDFINNLNDEVHELKEKLFREAEQNCSSVNKYINELTFLQDTVTSLQQQNTNATNKINNLNEKIIALENEIVVKTEENTDTSSYIDFLRDDLIKEATANDGLQVEINNMKKHMEALNTINFSYVSVIQTLENKITELKNLILDKETTISSLSNTLTINQKVMKNNHEHNQNKIHKLKNYLSDLNDFISYNMVTNEQLQTVQNNLENEVYSKYKLLIEMDNLKDKNIMLENTIEELNKKINENYVYYHNEENYDGEKYDGENYDEENCNDNCSDDENCYYNYDELQNYLVPLKLNTCDNNVSEDIFVNSNFNINNNSNIEAKYENTFIDTDDGCNIQQNDVVQCEYNHFIDTDDGCNTQQNNVVIIEQNEFIDTDDVWEVDTNGPEPENNQSYNFPQHNDFIDTDEIYDDNNNCPNSEVEHKYDNNFIDTDDCDYADCINDEGDCNNIINEIQTQMVAVESDEIDTTENDSDSGDFDESDTYDYYEDGDCVIVMNPLYNDKIDTRESFHTECDIVLDENIMAEYQNKNKSDIINTIQFQKKYTIIENFI